MTGGTRPRVELHVLTDETLQSRFTHADLARMAAGHGADFVQLREKRERGFEDRVTTARAVRDAIAGTRARLIVDDRADVAAAVGAAGVHLGRDDDDPATVRRVLGTGARIGVTANSLEEALRVAGGPADYLGVGPVFGTRSKHAPAPALGLAALQEIVERVARPVVAIGSIDADRVGRVLDCGVAGIAVLSAVVCAPDPARETARLRAAIDAWVAGAALAREGAR